MGDLASSSAGSSRIFGTVLMIAGSVMRQTETEIKRKPPGTL